MRQQRRSHSGPPYGEDAVGGELAAVKERLESLTRHLERMAHASADPNAIAEADERAEHLSNAMARLDNRLDEIVAEDRDATHEFYRRGQYAPHPAQPVPPQPAANPGRALGPNPSPAPTNWAAQIAARQRALDAAHVAAATPPTSMPRQASPEPSHWEAQIAAGQRTLVEPPTPAAPAYGTARAYAPAYSAPTATPPAYAAPAYSTPAAAAAAAAPSYAAAPPAPPAPVAPPQPNWSSQFSALQQQLHQLNSHVSSLHQPYENSVSALQQQLDQLNTHVSSLHKPYEKSVSGLQQQLHQLNTQISSLHQPYENSLTTLRSDLSRFGQTLSDAMPRRALETLEGEVRSLGERVEDMRHNSPQDAALGAMRQELAEIRNVLPRFDVAQGFGHVSDALRDLHHKVDQVAAFSQASRIDPTAFKQLEQAVNALRGSNLASDVALGQIAAEVRALGLSFDRLSAESGAAAFSRLEALIASIIETGLAARPEVDGSIREIGERLEHMQVSQGHRLDQLQSGQTDPHALGALDGSIRQLGERFEQMQLSQSDRDALGALDGSIRELGERFEQMQLSHSDRHALGALEDRIASLSEKLDISDSRLGHLEAIERGVADLLVHLEEMRNGNGRALRAPQIEPAPAPAAPPPPVPAAVAPQPAHTPSAMDLLLPEAPLPGPSFQPAAEAPTPAPRPQQQLQPLAPRAAPVEVEPVAQPEPARPPVAKAMPPRGPQRQPIDPNLPADTPLEPGSGAPRIKPGSAAARIAASEAALGNSRPTAMETGGKSAAIAAARNAARAAYADTSAKAPKSSDGKSRKWLTWPFKKAAKEFVPSAQPHAPAPPPSLPPMPPATLPAASMASAMPPSPRVDDVADAAPSPRAKAMKLLKTILIAASVAIIIAGVAQIGMEYLFPGQAPAPVTRPPKDQSQSLSVPKTQALAIAPSWPVPTPAPATAPATTPEVPQPAAPAADPDSTNSIGRSSAIFDPTTAVKLPDVTGSISQGANPTRAPAPGASPDGQSSRDTLPASISPALRTAVAANDPAAQYEMGVRYADGRGVPQSLPDAIRWFEMAAEAGFTPAQFRLGSLNEKGEGVRKDVKAAQRLYLAAAAKGHAKAMHNLAVLNAEGIDGRPDYKAASEWFRKAAGYGVTDSQYNLAILFARGIGVQVNLAESYKWFALAAANGDSDAAKKRDEVAARLDAATLATAKLAVQAFIPEREPDEATNLRTPAGGWDHAAIAPAKPRRRS